MVDGDKAAKVNICVDFDDTIAVRAFGTVFPAEGVVEAFNRLRNNGYKIVVHSARAWEKFEDRAERIDEMRRLLDQWGVPYNEIWVGAGKPVAKAYVDDKAVRFDNNWKDIVDSILNLE
jgi:hypothetical protein